MGRLSRVRRDESKQSEGVWCQYEADIRVRIRHIGYRPYQDAANELTRPHRMRITSDSIYTDELHRIVAPAVARYLIVGWENVEDDNDQPITFSVSEAEKFLIDPRYQDFLEWVIDEARQAQNFREEQHEESAKNSESVSIGTGE